MLESPQGLQLINYEDFHKVKQIGLKMICNICKMGGK